MRLLIALSAAETDRRSERPVRTLVSSGRAAPPPLSFSHTILFHLHLSAADQPAPLVKYRNFEGAELKADLSAGEKIEVRGLF
jgi:hypothetical protein